MTITNKKTKEEIKAETEAVLEETPPEITEPIVVEPGKEEEPIVPPVEETPEEVKPSEPITPEVAPEPVEEVKPVEPVVVPQPVVTPKEVAEPTEEELREYIKQEGSDFDELTNFEKSMAKKNLINDRKVSSLLEASSAQKKIVEWNNKIDTFLSTTNDNPKYVNLGGNEAKFKEFCMKEENRGINIESVLLPAFLYNLPAKPPKRGSLLEHGGGGERVEHKEGVVDAEMAAKLRKDDPREYARQVKAGKIKIDID